MVSLRRKQIKSPDRRGQGSINLSSFTSCVSATSCARKGIRGPVTASKGRSARRWGRSFYARLLWQKRAMCRVSDCAAQCADFMTMGR